MWSKLILENKRKIPNALKINALGIIFNGGWLANREVFKRCVFKPIRFNVFKNSIGIDVLILVSFAKRFHDVRDGNIGLS